jgi:putative endonuclease
LKTEKREFGDYGEKVARDYFLKKGYRFLASNFSFKKYEIDLVFEDEKSKTIIFIEVKTRATDRNLLPEDAITAAKQRKVRNGAYFFIKLNREFRDYDMRFDSFSVIKNESEFRINHKEYAF